MNRVTDLLLVVVITVLPLLLLPAVMPYRVGDTSCRSYYSSMQTAEGTWLYGLLEKGARFLFSHLNFHTAVLVNETMIT